MAVSVVPELIDALVAAASDTLGHVQVFDGMGVTADPGDYLMVGVDDNELRSSALAADVQQSWATMGGRVANRDEEGEITCIAYSWNGGNDQRAARVAVYDIAEQVAAFLRADATLGVASVLACGFGSQLQLSQHQFDYGVDALLIFRIRFQAVI